MRALRMSGKALGVVAALAGLTVYAAVAFADTIIGDANSTTNTIATDIEGTISLGANQSRTARFGLLVNDNSTDDLNGCNTQAGSPVTLRVTSNKSWVTVSATGAGGTYGASADIVVNGCDDGAGLANGLSNGTLLHYKTGAVVPNGEQATVTGAYLSGGDDASRDAGFQPADFTNGSFTVNGVAVTNTAPSVSFTTPPTTANEGDTKTFNFSVSDSDAGDTFSVAAGYPACGTGGTYVADSLSTTASGGSFQCTFPDGPASPTVSIQVKDGSNAASNIATAPVTVANVAPTVDVSGADSANEGDTKTYTYTVSDPGADPNPVVTESCGDNGSPTDTAAVNSFTCTFPDGPNTSTVSVSANDGDPANNIGSDSILVTIANLAPSVGTLTVGGATGTACLAGNSVTLDFSFSDAGVNDADWAVTIDWDDGSTDTTYDATAQGAQTQQSHTYLAAGSHQISVTVEDKDGDDGSSAANQGSVSLLYNMTGILAPFNADGSSIWKYGSTLPVKVRITDCNQTPVSTLKPQVAASMNSSLAPTDGVVETQSTSNADTTGVMRYSDGQYIYNFASKYLADGNATYTMYVRGKDAAGNIVTDAAQSSVRFGLKTK